MELRASTIRKLLVLHKQRVEHPNFNCNIGSLYFKCHNRILISFRPQGFSISSLTGPFISGFVSTNAVTGFVVSVNDYGKLVQRLDIGCQLMTWVRFPVMCYHVAKHRKKREISRKKDLTTNISENVSVKSYLNK